MPTLALSTGSLHTYGLNRAWTFAAEAGFDAVEVLIDARWDTRQPAYLRALAGQTGLPVAALHTPFRPLKGFGDDYPACAFEDRAGKLVPRRPFCRQELFLSVNILHYLAP